MIYFYIYFAGLREETEAFHREKKIHPAWRPPWLRYQILVKMVFQNIALKEFPASPRRISQFSPVLCFLFLCDICVHSGRNVRTMCWWFVFFFFKPFFPVIRWEFIPLKLTCGRTQQAGDSPGMTAMLPFIATGPGETAAGTRVSWTVCVCVHVLVLSFLQLQLPEL